MEGFRAVLIIDEKTVVPVQSLTFEIDTRTGESTYTATGRVATLPSEGDLRFRYDNLSEIIQMNQLSDKDKRALRAKSTKLKPKPATIIGNKRLIRFDV